MAIASGCGGAGKKNSPGQAASIAEQIAAAQREADPADRARELIRIGHQQAQAKDLGGASETLSLAASSAGDVPDSEARTRIFTSLTKVQTTADDRLAASRSLAKAEAAVAKIDSPLFRAEARVKLANLQAILKSKAVAFSTLQAVAAETLNSAARAIGQPADPEVDVDLALSNDVVMLLHVAVVYHELGGQDEARQTVDATLGITDKMKDDRDRSRALGEAGKALASLGQQERSRTTFDRALAAARTVGTELSKAYALKEIAVQLAAADQPAKAREVLAEAETAAQRVREPDLQRQALDEIERGRSALRQP